MIGTPAKRARLDCVIHCSSSDEELVSPKDIESWRTLLTAAEVRHHKPILDIAKDLPHGTIPGVAYHRKCRSIFTMKRDLEALKSMRNSNEENKGSAERERVSRPVPSQSRVYLAECLFCKKTSKYSKRDRTREPLVQCSDLRADEKIRKAAANKLDSRVLASVSRDLVAAEGHYHRSCYRMYTKNSNNIAQESSDGSGATAPDTDHGYEAAEKQSFNELFSYIREELFASPDVVPMATLTARIVGGMVGLGKETVKASTKKHIRRRLEVEFEESLQMTPDENGKLLVYPSSLSMPELVTAYQKLQTKVQNMESEMSDDIIAKAALQIRDDVKKQDFKQTWPPQMSEDMPIPTSVTRFLYTLLTGTTDLSSPSDRIQRLCTSFSHDFVYAITNGKVKPAKHVTLPFAVKSLTGNVELVHILNRLGHGVSYSQVEEIDTALCVQKLSASDGKPALPRDINAGVFTTLAWDNIDRLEETVSGKGTSHRVNGIAVQPKSQNPKAKDPEPCLPKTKKRSIDTEPLMLPAYNAGARVGPPEIQGTNEVTRDEVELAKKKNLVWLLARMCRPDAQDICSWTGFNILSRDEVTVVEDSVGYLATINAPATQLSTVNEILQQSISIMRSLQLKTIVCVFDQALFAKAAEVVWKHPGKFEGIVLRLGVFHTICTLLATIGKRFQDGGLRDLCVEAGVIADGSVAGVMDGRKYNRAVRLHKLLYETFMRLAWKGFLQWLASNHSDYMVHLEETLRATSSLCEDVCQAAVREMMDSQCCDEIFKMFEVYLDYLRKENGPLSAFWMSYVDMVEVMLGLIRASREGDWKLHLASIREMIPWCFAYDKLNYARYLPYYYAQMSRLAIDHPDVHEQFMQGQGFSVQLASSSPFARIPVDQAIEVTNNKDTQTPGGTKGFSLKPGAVSRYYLTSEYRSSYLRELRDIVGTNSSRHLNHPDLHLPRIKKDEADVRAFEDLIENSWINPLSHDETELVNLSTGILAPPDVASDLLKAHQVGEEAYKEFRENRLEGDTPRVKFHSKMEKQNLKTFSNVNKKQTGKVLRQQIILKADRNLFAHMIIIAQSRKIPIKEVLAHPLGPLPWSLANSDGSLRKTNKAALARELEKNVPPAEDMPTPSACIIDGMSLVHKLKADGKTFEQLADSALQQALHEGTDSARIDVVFDVYRDSSIKNSERCNRGADTGTKWKNIAPGHSLLQWRKFLRTPENKISLIEFLVNQWKQPAKRGKLQGKSLYVTCGEKCYLFTINQWTEIQTLKTTQEEADTRVLLHAWHAAEDGYRSIVITADDTDVFILSVCLSKKLACPLYLKSGTENRTRYIDLCKLASSLGEDVCQALVGLHAFTGCDTVSSFAGRGKVAALKLLRESPVFKQAFQQLGVEWGVPSDLFEKMQEFVCRMYAYSTTSRDVNDLRYQIFNAKRGDVESSQLPPCKDCLHMHVLRANYQTAIWRRCLERQPVVPDPKSSGWTTDQEGNLTIEWMRGPPAPEAVLQLLSCKCVRACKLPDCVCLVNQLKCTYMCKLQTCANQRKEDEDNKALDEEASDDSDIEEY